MRYVYGVPLTFYGCRSFWGHSWCTCLQIACNLKMAGYRAKGMKFGTCSMRGHFGDFRCICLKMACNSFLTMCNDVREWHFEILTWL